MGKWLFCALLSGLAFLGVVCLLIGFTSLFLVPHLVDQAIRNEDHLGRDENGTFNMVLQRFEHPPYTIRLQIWTYSVQNSDGVIHRGEKPKIVEKGPYTFKVTMQKKEIIFSQNDTRLSYRQDRQYHYESSESCATCNLKDRVVVPNIIFQKLIDIAMQSWIYKTAIEAALSAIKKESVFIEVPVNELLFDGYKDPLVEKVCNHQYLRDICKSLGVPERIGLFYKQNNTDDGVYQIDTGLNGVVDLAKVYSWNGSTKSLSDKYWYGPRARMINGTNGELFQPFLFSNPNLQIFIGQLCRTLELEYKQTAFSQGIANMRYGPADSMNDVDLQKSMGFCNPKTPMFFNNSQIQQQGCTPAGVVDMGSCVEGNPRIYMSQPHFKNCPTALNEAFVGMTAPSDDDLSHFDIEPLTGVIVEVRQRSQLNLGMLRGNLNLCKNMRADVIAPIIWVNESAIIDSTTRDQVLQATSFVAKSFLAGLILVILGVLFIISFVGVFVGRRLARKRQLDQLEATTPLVNAAVEE